MKVTKQKSGYNVRLTHSDYEMLSDLLGMISADEAKKRLSGDGRSAYTRRSKTCNGNLMAVDADRSDRVVNNVPPQAR